MTIDTVAATSAAGMYTSSTSTRAPSQSLDSDAFMTLLITQLQNQDPSSPMDTTAMIQQTTQLAMMEKLTAIESTATENFSLQMRIAAAGLVGQEVSYAKADGTVVTGTATSVSYTGAVPTVSVGGVDIALDVISGIKAAPAAPAATPAS